MSRRRTYAWTTTFRITVRVLRVEMVEETAWASPKSMSDDRHNTLSFEVISPLNMPNCKNWVILKREDALTGT